MTMIHQLTGNCATRLARNGVDLDAVREMLGHSSIQTTALYLHSDEARLREVADMAGFAGGNGAREPAPAEPPNVLGQVQHPPVERETESAWRRAAWRRKRPA